MTDNEIIKALECCIKSSHFGECFENGCPMVSEEGCKVGKETLYPYALDLINRQKAELNELYQEREQAKHDIEKALAELKELELSYEKDIQTARVEATNEFAEMLKEKTRTRDRVIIYAEDIDNLLKEKAGE